MSAKYIVGIDLGTTHSVMAYTPAETSDREEPQVHLMEIPQLVGPGEIEARPLLPSFLFLPGPHDVPEGGLALPWNRDADHAVGEFARERGAEIPSRLVVSAKSWLTYTGVDRTQPILPWDAPSGQRRVSPVEASARYLEHLKNAWNHVMAREDPSARLEDQEIYLTVPASFDPIARELTLEAARAAGLGEPALIEEPQAAFYAWLDVQKDRWRDAVRVGDSILVCDVGGGTTDFSLIRVSESDGTLELERVAVGEHILLGGDNMDLTLAYAVRAKLARGGDPIDDGQFRSLWHACRKAKERLLGDPELDSEPVVVLGRGSSLIAGTLRTELTRAELESVLLEGFFPPGAISEGPVKRPPVGMREMGLPYESDPAITRHLASFLSKHGAQGGFPSAVLFNGGVMKAAPLRERILDALRRWGAGEALRELTSAHLDRAVALGAAYYGLVRRGRGIRIRAGAPRSYYIGIEAAMPSVPGVPTPMKALCVVPFGMEEGTEVDLRGREFGLVVGDDAVFHFLGSATRKEDGAGEQVEDWTGEIQPIATLETRLPATGEEQSGTVIPVWLRSKVTPLGTLELWCVSRDEERQWKLEFNIREQGSERGE